MRGHKRGYSRQPLGVLVKEEALCIEQILSGCRGNGKNDTEITLIHTTHARPATPRRTLPQSDERFRADGLVAAAEGPVGFHRKIVKEPTRLCGHPHETAGHYSVNNSGYFFENQVLEFSIWPGSLFLGSASYKFFKCLYIMEGTVILVPKSVDEAC